LIFGGFVYLLRGILLNEKENLDYLPFMYSLISVTGALFVLFSTPIGFTTLTEYGLKLYLPASSRHRLKEKIHALDLEEQVITSRISDNHCSRGEKDLQQRRLQEVRTKLISLHRTTMHPLISNVLSLMITVLNLAFAAYVVLRVFIHLMFFAHHASSNLDFLTLQDSSAASFSSFWQVAVIIYMMTSAVVGFYNLPLMERIKPQVGHTSMAKLIINMGCILLISSSFPVVARILEITSFDLLGDYSHTKYLRNELFLDIYKTAFMMVFAYRYFIFFNKSWHDTGLVSFLANLMTFLSHWQTKSPNPKNSFVHLSSSPSMKKEQ